ncbi:hypothetical protein JJD41_07580 [Oxynema sp. CENA135]|uniref:hypothetical protein n=1 Tax=Oxynema sp. CENA135 TaxID=984206 RepID=UPI00190CD30C|nr:hypothetical protein [Oxynema sp. CENA135]MBK4729729.1 hypothetical protein [Oxynema sp. CENA135]
MGFNRQSSHSNRSRDRAKTKLGIALALLFGASLGYLGATSEGALARFNNPSSPPNAIDEALADYSAIADEEVKQMRQEALEAAVFNGETASLPGTGYCRNSGECTESYYLRRVLSAEAGDERLYSTETMTRLFQMSDPDPNPSGLPPGEWSFGWGETMVLCSSDRPMTIDITREGTYLMNAIDPSNPQTYIFGGVRDVDALYWQFCHDRPIQAGEDLTEIARQLGYGPELEARTTEVEALSFPLQ